MNTWKVILATLVIFGAGVITGGLLVGYSDRALHNVPSRPPAIEVQRETTTPPVTGLIRENRPAMPPPPNALFRKDFMDRLNHELELSPQQHEHIEKIVTDGQDRTRELWRMEWVETRQKIRRELGPKQQGRFEELFKSRPHEKLHPNPARPGTTTDASLPSGSTNSPSPAVNP
jgi:hypothetical protein